MSVVLSQTQLLTMNPWVGSASRCGGLHQAIRLLQPQGYHSITLGSQYNIFGTLWYQFIWIHVLHPPLIPVFIQNHLVRSLILIPHRPISRCLYDHPLRPIALHGLDVIRMSPTLRVDVCMRMCSPLVRAAVSVELVILMSGLHRRLHYPFLIMVS